MQEPQAEENHLGWPTSFYNYSEGETTPTPSPPLLPLGVLVETTISKTEAEYFQTQTVCQMGFYAFHLPVAFGYH